MEYMPLQLQQVSRESADRALATLLSKAVVAQRAALHALTTRAQTDVMVSSPNTLALTLASRRDLAATLEAKRPRSEIVFEKTARCAALADALLQLQETTTIQLGREGTMTITRFSAGFGIEVSSEAVSRYFLIQEDGSVVGMTTNFLKAQRGEGDIIPTLTAGPELNYYLTSGLTVAKQLVLN